LVEYKSNLITWLHSLGADHDQTCVTFVRNMYPMDPATSSYMTTSAKPVWVTGLGVDFALDCGSGKVALVDGVLGTQQPGGIKWVSVWCVVCGLWCGALFVRLLFPSHLASSNLVLILNVYVFLLLEH